MNRIIRKVAVLGSGTMGAQIACHCANTGFEVLLLDIVPKELTEPEKAKGLSLEDKAVRNRIVNSSLKKTIKASPSPLFKKEYASRIQTGNFEDDLEKIKDCDWILEAIIEKLEIKQSLFEKVEQHRKPGSIVSSNTSGIPINILAEGRSGDFKKHFMGTHFFNPPRYLPLLELIPNRDTSEEVISFMKDYGDRYLGKTTIVCKDTPAFIANRIGIYAIMLTFHLMKELNLSVEDIDSLTGPVVGRPKSATFRTADLVGLDVLGLVAQRLSENLSEQEEQELFGLPDFLKTMLDKGWTGEKAGQGFYKKIKKDGESVILSLDIDTLDYSERKETSFATLEQAKQESNLKKRFKILLTGNDKAGEFYRKFFYHLFAYVTRRIPEIADHIYQLDQGLKAGFDWKLGPFEIWDALGFKGVLEELKNQNLEVAGWVNKMPEHGFKSFYFIEEGEKYFYDCQKLDYEVLPASKAYILLENYRENYVVWQNSGCTLMDIGDGVVNLEFHTRGNSIGSEVLEGINKSIEIASEKFKGLVIGNEGNNFSVGANLGLVFMLAVEQEYDELDLAVREFQKATTNIKYSPVPVVVAPHTMTLGGGTEMCLHSAAVQAAAETYMGLVEVGVGLIPAGGGTKEMIRRAAKSYYDGDPKYSHLQNFLLTIAQAKVSMSADEAFDLNLLREGIDNVTMNKQRLIADAKGRVIELSDSGYTPPDRKEKILVLGRGALAMFLTGINAFKTANYITAHDALVSQKLAYVMCGGDLTSEQEVDEQYLLDLEKEAFLSLLGEKKTLERIESVLKGGKPLRN